MMLGEVACCCATCRALEAERQRLQQRLTDASEAARQPIPGKSSKAGDASSQAWPADANGLSPRRSMQQQQELKALRLQLQAGCWASPCITLFQGVYLPVVCNT